MSTGNVREFRALERKAKRLGFTIHWTRGGRAIWSAPDGRTEHHGRMPRPATVAHVERWLRRWDDLK
jgi:hypothetical protein